MASFTVTSMNSTLCYRAFFAHCNCWTFMHSEQSCCGTILLRKVQTTMDAWLPWTEKYRPKVPNDIIGNKSLVKQLHDWLTHWDEQFLSTGSKGKGKKHNDSSTKKAVLLSGTPGIGKTTSAKVVSQILGFQTIEVGYPKKTIQLNKLVSSERKVPNYMKQA